VTKSPNNPSFSGTAHTQGSSVEGVAQVAVEVQAVDEIEGPGAIRAFLPGAPHQPAGELEGLPYFVPAIDFRIVQLLQFLYRRQASVGISVSLNCLAYLSAACQSMS
jgi:hypothetical protein